jgi:membrane protein YdbS with pleckstrin-like domain
MKQDNPSTGNQEELLQNERVIYETRLHWALLLGPAMVIILGGLSVSTRGWSAVVAMAIGFAWGIFSYLKLNYSVIQVTNQRVLIRTSILLRRPLVINLSNIKAVDFYQPSLGGMLNFGKITIAHGTRYRSVFRMVRAPADLTNVIRGQATAVQQGS